MPVTIQDATDAAHSAVMDVEQWAQEFEREWLSPQLEMEQARTVAEALQLWDAMPEELRAQMEQRDPQGYAQVVRNVKKLRKEVRKNGDN